MATHCLFFRFGCTSVHQVGEGSKNFSIIFENEVNCIVIGIKVEATKESIEVGNDVGLAPALKLAVS